MAFQIKDFTSITAGMLNRMKATTRKITDFNIGAIGRTIVEAVATEIDELYQQIFHGLVEAIKVAIYNTFDFGLLPPIPASGVITVTIASQATATLIPSGTVFSPTGGSNTYTSTLDVTIAAGSTSAPVVAYANAAGAATNLAASVSFTPNPAPAGFVTAINPAAFSNGADAETEDQRKLRFNQFIQTLQRGTPLAIEYGAKLTFLTDANGVESERVAAAVVVEPWLTDNTQPIGLINVYIHNGVGGTTDALVTQANSIIYGYVDSNGNKVPGWKAAGTRVIVAKATEQVQNVAGVLTPAPGYATATLISQAVGIITAYMLGLDIGEPFEVSELTAMILAIPGVANFILSTPSPTADVAATDAHHKIMPGSVIISNNIGTGVGTLAAPVVAAHT